MAENTKERIISAVFSFYRDGKIKKISLSKIAAEVGISKAAIFRHFANREELEETLLQTVYDRFASLVTAVQGMLGRGDSSAVLPFIIETLCRHTEYINYLRSTSPDFSLDTFVLEGKKRGVRMFDSVFAPDGSVQNKRFYYTAVLSAWNCWNLFTSGIFTVKKAMTWPIIPSGLRNLSTAVLAGLAFFFPTAGCKVLSRAALPAL